MCTTFQKMHENYYSFSTQMTVGDFGLPVFGPLVVLLTTTYILWRSNRLIMSEGTDEDFRKCTKIDNYVFIGITCIICTSL
jgi:hypothetical protein